MLILIHPKCKYWVLSLLASTWSFLEFRRGMDYTHSEFSCIWLIYSIMEILVAALKWKTVRSEYTWEASILGSFHLEDGCDSSYSNSAELITRLEAKANLSLRGFSSALSFSSNSRKETNLLAGSSFQQRVLYLSTNLREPDDTSSFDTNLTQGLLDEACNSKAQFSHWPYKL